MREYIEANLVVIRKYLKKRKKYTSKLNNASIIEEFKEWSKDPLPETESIWTLPDLTRNERLKNFCRSIKKEIREGFNYLVVYDLPLSKNNPQIQQYSKLQRKSMLQLVDWNQIFLFLLFPLVFQYI